MAKRPPSFRVVSMSSTHGEGGGRIETPSRGRHRGARETACASRGEEWVSRRPEARPFGISFGSRLLKIWENRLMYVMNVLDPLAFVDAEQEAAEIRFT